MCTAKRGSTISVAYNEDIRFRRLWQQYRRGEGRYLPIGTWLAQLGITGDASGGSASLLASAPTARQQELHLYSLEQFIATNRDATSRIWQVRLNPQESLDGSGATVWQMMCGPSVAGYDEASIGWARMGGGGHSVGSLHGLTWIWRPSLLAWSIQAVTANVNTIVNRFMAWGYVWDRSPYDRGEIPVRPD